MTGVSADGYTTKALTSVQMAAQSFLFPVGITGPESMQVPTNMLLCVGCACLHPNDVDVVTEC